MSFYFSDSNDDSFSHTAEKGDLAQRPRMTLTRCRDVIFVSLLEIHGFISNFINFIDSFSCKLYIAFGELKQALILEKEIELWEQQQSDTTEDIDVTEEEEKLKIELANKKLISFRIAEKLFSELYNMLTTMKEKLHKECQGEEKQNGFKRPAAAEGNNSREESPFSLKEIKLIEEFLKKIDLYQYSQSSSNHNSSSSLK